MIMRVDTEVLRWFQLVVDGATVTEVAELHMVSQPGVSRALARLDREVGVELLQKQGRVLRPTHAGSVFKRHVDASLHRLDDAMAAVSELVDPETGRVSIAFQLSLGTWLVPALIADFKAQHPRVRFALEHSDDAIGSLVAEGLVDLEFTSRRPGDPTVTWQRLLSQPLVLAVPGDHPLGRYGEVALAQACDAAFVGLRPSWHLRTRSDELCAAAGFEPDLVFEADDLPVVHGFVAAGLGVAIVPATSNYTLADQPAVRLVRLTDPDAYREIGLSWSRERRLLPTAMNFRDHALAASTRAS